MVGPMFVTTVHADGLPGPEGTVSDAGKRFEFSFCLAEANGNRWLMGIPSQREDRVTYLPISEAQGLWVNEQSDLMVPAGIELSFWFHDACSAFEFVERLGPCRQGATLQERYLEHGNDLVALPRTTAEEWLGCAHDALAEHAYALAFDRATRLLVAEGFRIDARRLRHQVLRKLGCADAATREQIIIDRLGAPHVATAMPSVAPLALALTPGCRSVAVELQGLPLGWTAVENEQIRYLFRLDVPSEGPSLVRFPLDSKLETELPEQERWLSRAGATRDGANWTLRDDDAVEQFVSAAQPTLRGTDRWDVWSRIRRAREESRLP